MTFVTICSKITRPIWGHQTAPWIPWGITRRMLNLRLVHQVKLEGNQQHQSPNVPKDGKIDHT